MHCYAMFDILRQSIVRRGDAMETRFRSWWQQIKQRRAVIMVVVIILIIAIVLIIIGYWFDWTGFNGYNKVTITHIISGANAGTVTKTEEYQPGKGLWDWLQLIGILAIPVVVGFGAAWFTTQQSQAEANRAAQQVIESEANRKKRHDTDIEISNENREKQRETDLQIAADNQHEAAFRSYLDKMSELLIEKQLGESAPDDQVRKIARIQTLAVLLGLDPIRKGSVLQFLYEYGLIEKDNLIEKDKRIIDLFGANLSKADLGGANLSKADLGGANLREAQLYRANLREAILHGAYLHNANLRVADLSGADLREARLYGADLWRAILRGADLSGADLSGAHLNGAKLLGAIVTTEQLAQAKSLKDATMPDGSTHP
jgi:Pentapeptide repeats (8 copies)